MFQNNGGTSESLQKKFLAPYWRRAVFLWLMTALSIALFGLARIAAAGLSPAADAEILLTGDTVTEDTVEGMRMLEKQQDAPLIFTLWEEEKDALAENADWDRQANVSALLLNGDSDLLLDGTVLKQDDTGGCLIDAVTAGTLFGSRNVVGNELQYGGQTFIIRGILPEKTPVLVVQAAAFCHGSAGSGISFGNGASGGSNSGVVAFHHISLRFPSEGSNGKRQQGSSSQIEEFLVRHGLTGENSRQNGISNLAAAFSFLLPVVLWGSLLGKTFALMRKNRQYPVRLLLTALLLLGLVWLFFRLTEIHPQIPEDMIPTRWSDFSFWSRWAKEQTENFITFLSLEKSPMALQRLRLMGTAAAAGSGAVICYFFSSLRRTDKSTESLKMTETSASDKMAGNMGSRQCIRRLFILVLIHWGIFWLLAVRAGQAGNVLAQERELWFLLPVYALFQYFFFCI